MKDATGELSMTAIAVVAIAAIAVVFTTLIWPSIQANITRSSRCSQTLECHESASGNEGILDCTYCINEDCSEQGTVQCPAK